jgi:seryl-tRNA synthetase
MRNKRITIKHPVLRKLRNNLRKIIKQAVLLKENELLEKSRNMWKGKNITNELREQLREIDKQINELRRALQVSICECTACAKSDTDMIFHPRWKAWYCPDCYDASIKYKPPPHESELDDN